MRSSTGCSAVDRSPSDKLDEATHLVRRMMLNNEADLLKAVLPCRTLTLASVDLPILDSIFLSEVWADECDVA